MKLICIRHGQTFYNSEGRIQGQLDSELSPLGRRQCQAVAAVLATLEIDAVISSPLKRALETARVIAEPLGLGVEIDERLMEINAGVFQGFSWTEIDERFPAETARWRSHDPDFRIPSGESRRDLMLRASQAFHDIRADHRQAIVVAHGGTLSSAFKADARNSRRAQPVSAGQLLDQHRRLGARIPPASPQRNHPPARNRLSRR